MRIERSTHRLEDWLAARQVLAQHLFDRPVRDWLRTRSPSPSDERGWLEPRDLAAVAVNDAVAGGHAAVPELASLPRQSSTLKSEPGDEPAQRPLATSA